MKNQLYKNFKNVVLPSYVSRTGRYAPPACVNKTYQNIALTIWPNGRPCMLVNIWLDSVASASMGETETSTTYASNISHLIRFCWERKIEFNELEDSHFHELARSLVEEPHALYSDRAARGNNHIRTIMSTAVRFLIWYQDKFLNKKGKLLIGEENSNYAITVKKKLNPKSMSYYYTHLAFPPAAPEDSEKKHPISDEQINAIQDEISRRNSPTSISAVTANLAKYDHRKLGCQMEYEYERRTFCVWMLERFGLRPSEIFGIPPIVNAEIISKLVIKLPTKKTRRHSGKVMRSLKISMSDAVRYTRYIESRSTFITFLSTQEPHFITPAGLLLTRYGTDIKLNSLNRDFYRIKETADLLDTQLTQSMYRHRFITYHVLIKFREEAGSNKIDPLSFSTTMQMSILKEVAALTGHRDPKSLWPYIDVAFGLLKVTQSIDSAILTLSEAQTFRSSLDGWLRDYDNCESTKEKEVLLHKIRLHMESLARPPSVS
ncbi:hypothetical protein BV337_00499 [Pseudomonas syringae pv. actinidiae]|nr:hypothetical protein BV327_01161 [Pseudomonas syringae pv. actinidiae]OSS32664.1 hypothetical protein BV337_00499 [Pseudomonas syringae pv. actinidiae]